MSDPKNINIVSNDEVNVKESSLKKRKIELLAKANTLPKSAGCYFMQGKLGEILYVGKAKNLKARVTSYFNNSAKSPKTEILVGHIHQFDFILTNSEVESLVLENNLIKEHKPKYNIMLRDDKTYPYVLIKNSQDFPRIEYVRRPKRKKDSVLFGPFPVGSNISKIIRILTKAFTLRDCTDHEFKGRENPCLLYQMKQCSAPCVGKISSSDYKNDLENALNLFRGPRKIKISLEILTKQMMGEAEQENFEQAASIRDYLEEFDQFVQKSFDQNVEALKDNNLDVFAFYIGEDEVDISLYMIREGNLLGHKNFNFLFTDFMEEANEEILLAILQYYQQNEEVIPEKIVTSLPKELNEKLQNALRSLLGEGIKFKVLSATKKYESLIQATRKHAEESQRVRLENQDSVFIGLNKLQALLNLKERPKLLECYDVAVWQGKSPTASQIVFYEGKADKTQYRYYHLEERPEGNNDFAMMTEVFSRRLKKGNWPDVFIVDGGVQQVNTVKKVLEDHECDRPVVGIAKARDLKSMGFKDKEVKHSDERLVIPGRSNPYILNKNVSLMRIVVQMRDEAHRFSRKLHHKAEKKRIIKSWIDEVRGLNPSVREQILRTNTLSLEDLREFNMTQLQNFLGLETKHARAVYKFLHAEENFN